MSAAVWLCVARVEPTLAQAQAAGLAWIGDDARRRLSGLTAPLRRAQFIAGRWALRSLLFERFGVTEAQLQTISAEPDAPPRLSAQGAGPLHLAISHSDDWLSCAVSSAEIGIDIQVPRPRRDRTALIEFVCTAQERQRLQGFAAEIVRQRFDELWTLKEAWIKRPGATLGLAELHLLETWPAAASDANARAWSGPGFTLGLAVRAGVPVHWHEPPPLQYLEPSLWRVQPAARAQGGR